MHAQWQSQNSNTNEHLTSIQFLNSDVGYIIGENGVFLKTLNGGEDWIQLEIPFSGGDIANPPSLHFINEQIGMIEVDYKGIAKTIDGGNSWTIMEIGADFGAMNIRLMNENEGILVNDNKIFRTNNLGATWQAIDMANLSDEFFSSDEVEFLNDKVGWIVTNSIMLKTIDGGLSWELDFDYWTHADLSTVGALLHRIEAISDDTLFVGSRYYIGFFSSFNAGINFEYTPMLVKDIAFLDAKAGFAIDDQNSIEFIKKTMDGGVTWTSIY
ncbi:MAG: YCF48-related protein, partial [Bacteroidota bacterium]